MIFDGLVAYFADLSQGPSFFLRGSPTDIEFPQHPRKNSPCQDAKRLHFGALGAQLVPKLDPSGAKY